jgi:hypothetical protein
MRKVQNEITNYELRIANLMDKILIIKELNIN